MKYEATDGTATSGKDYILETAHLSLPKDGNATVKISLKIIDDSETEEDETLVITLSDPRDSRLGTNTVFTYTIVDNDGKGVPIGGGGSGGTGVSGGSIGGGGGGSGSTVQRKIVEFNDISKVKDKAVLDAIKKIGQLMVDNGTSDFGDKFGPDLKVTPGFAAQLGLAIMGKSCGAPQKRVKECLETGVNSGLFTGIDTKQKFITRGELYVVLLRAANIPLLPRDKITSKNLCKDVSINDANAEIIATARASRIANLYSGSKCNTKLLVRRSEAMLFALRVLNIMKK